MGVFPSAAEEGVAFSQESDGGASLDGTRSTEGKGREGLDRELGVGGWERVLALSNGSRTESPSQEGDVGGFIAGNFLKVLIKRVRETSCDEVGLGIVGETFTVEFVLEVLEGEGVVEDVDIIDASSTLDYWAGYDRGGSCKSSKGG